MDKYIRVLCEQNPNISFNCGNPDCKKEHTFKTNQVFKDRYFEFECTSCGKTTKVETTKFINDLSNEFKKFGITVK